MKNYLRRLALVVVVGIAGVGFVGADQYDKKTVITIDEAMQVPNTTLQPGTYVIKLVDSPSNRHIVQFWDKDEKHVITTSLAIPNERLRVTGKSVFAFWEVPAGQPKALRAWFYPGDDFGQEFAYRKAEAFRITASNSGATVPVNDEKAENESATATAAAEPAPAPAAIAAAEPAAAPAPVEIAAAPAQAPPPAPVAAPEEPARPVTADTSSDSQRVSQPASSDTLPRTASNLPLLGLIGLLSIVAALGLKLVYNRS